MIGVLCVFFYVCVCIATEIMSIASMLGTHAATCEEEACDASASASVENVSIASLLGVSNCMRYVSTYMH